jgi:triosephosphate isomerase
MNLPEEGIAPFIEATAAASLQGIEIAIAPPFVTIAELSNAVNDAKAAIVVGAQNCSDRKSGAFTGEVSGSMLVRAGVRYVILGHSERRTIFGESDELVGRKVRQALVDGLAPVWCVGEEAAAREAGETEQVLERQLRGGAAAAGELPADLVIAYEPVWAIGTGKTATPEMAADAHRFIRAMMEQIRPGISLRILYGGSVTPENAEALSAETEIDGFLIGGASLFSGKFTAIGRALAVAAEGRVSAPKKG